MIQGNFRNPFAVGILLLVPLVGAAAFFGRRIERAYPALIPLLKEGLFVALTVISAYSLLLLWRNTELKSLKRVAIAGFHLLALASVISVDYLLVAYPIERIHIFKYGGLAFCLQRWRFSSIEKNNYPSDRFRTLVLGSALMAFSAAAMLGSIEELSQKFIPSRIFDWRDVWLNISSAFVGAAYGLGTALSSNPGTNAQISESKNEDHAERPVP